MTPYIIIIAGPTAVGKTALAIEIAKRLDTAIISADSRQCFGELGIGVAKPSATELQQVQHYFIDSHSVHDNVNAVVFEQYALKATNDIFSKHNNCAVMVGGTGLYIKAFCEGLDNIPDVPEDIRQKVTTAFEEKGLQWLQQEIQEKDPAFWAVAEQQNPQRLMRALEVWYATGQSIEAFRIAHKTQRPFKIIKIGLELDRPLLYDRINARVDIMMQEGLLEEARALQPLQHLNALQTVGYREFFNFFNGEYTLEQAIDMLKQNTRHYAKRQLTWFKRDPAIQWFQPAQVNEIMQYISAQTGGWR
ncbi:tRNA (adenosine(37)-N6)-dimethylallyltransferase MiaA [Filimonas effusa]|uniref:tRNA dimethylallyltransferase n=1 Tax=Filimonas effusa TaxID=2508721 RepID=A0A4Q1D818_9BACT|nr:tRNA (adenosine(37)-N6)-dimethylallyltransferase MiaA [Filimonas effusa]RXK85457.1 tRNA (adenosine(37)-N6)-dimethylallyltransferase MiaA [Filimonas effusa]